jgi:hypothetical protein
VYKRAAASLYSREIATMKSITMIGLLLLVATNASAGTGIYTTLADENQIPIQNSQQRFYCSDQVFAVVELNDYAVGDHELHVSWLSPAGDVAESTRYNFLVLNNYELVWAWLKLHRQSGAGVLRWIDASAGMGEFIGSWKVFIEIDNTPIGEVPFEVIC